MDLDYDTDQRKNFLFNANAEMSSEARDLNFGLSITLLPYFVYVRSEGSDKLAHLCAVQACPSLH